MRQKPSVCGHRRGTRVLTPPCVSDRFAARAARLLRAHSREDAFSENGTVEGESSSYVRTAGVWSYWTLAIHGKNAALIVCGDQVRDVGEDCDTGEANGLVACCTADCVLDDPDGDHICSELDSCPDVYNYDQSQSVCRPLSFDVTKLKAKAARRLPDIDDSRVLFKGLLNGDGIAVIESIDAIRIQDASAYDHTVSGFVCSGDGSRMLCETTDRIASARIRATSSAVKLKVKLRAADIPGGSLIAPLTVSLTDNFGMTRADSVPYCDGCTF